MGMAALLAACAAVPPQRPTAESERLWSLRVASLSGLRDWGFSGRVAVQADEEGWHANLQWRQRPDRYDIRILAPLGQGAAWLHGDARGVRLRTAGNGDHYAADPETLLREQLGWQVPVSGLRYWVVGLPDAGAAAVKVLDADGRLVRLRQAGWDIEFQRYRVVDGMQLPDRIALSNARLKVRVLIDQWQLHDGGDAVPPRPDAG